MHVHSKLSLFFCYYVCQLADFITIFMYILNLTLEKMANLCCYHLKIIFIAHAHAQVIKLNEDLFIISLTQVGSIHKCTLCLFVCVCELAHRRRPHTEMGTFFSIRCQKCPTSELLPFSSECA